VHLRRKVRLGKASVTLSKTRDNFNDDLGRHVKAPLYQDLRAMTSSREEISAWVPQSHVEIGRQSGLMIAEKSVGAARFKGQLSPA
jgi:hypothetical protein